MLNIPILGPGTDEKEISIKFARSGIDEEGGGTLRIGFEL